MADISINGVDLSSHGFSLYKVEGWLTVPPITFSELPLYGRAGSLIDAVHHNTRPFSLSGYIEGATVSESRASLDAILSLVARAQPASVVFGDDTSRQHLGYLVDTTIEPVGPAFAEPMLDVTLRFVAASPFRYATTASSVPSIGSSGIVVPQGTAPVWPRVKVQGSATSPIVISLIDYNSTTVGTITFTMSLASSSDWLCVDFEKRTAYENTTQSFTSGTNRLDKWTAGDWWRILPEHAAYSTSAWPKIAVSAGTGVAMYTKAYF